MWAELIFSCDDLARLLAEALPLTIHLGAPEAEHSLSLSDLAEVRLVADAGLRVTCMATLHWPVLGIDIPVVLSSLTLLLVPVIERADDGDRLAFRGSVEHADFSALPTLVGDHVTSAINARLAAKNAELSWCFSRTLRYLVPLPSMLEPLDSFAIHAAWGELRITDEAIVCAASFHSAIVRSGGARPIDVDTAASAPATERLSSPRALAGRRRVLATRLAAAGAFGLAASAVYFAIHWARRAS